MQRAPGSKWRRDVVPKPRESSVACVRTAESAVRAVPPRGEPSSRRERQARGEPARVVAAATADRLACEVLSPPPKLGPGVTLLAPNILSVRHWERLLSGRLLAPAVRVDRANLLQRPFQVDVLACPRCGGRLRVMGEITQPAIVRLVLETLDIPTAAPQPARARAPTALLAELDMN